MSHFLTEPWFRIELGKYIPRFYFEIVSYGLATFRPRFYFEIVPYRAKVSGLVFTADIRRADRTSIIINFTRCCSSLPLL